MAIQDGTRGRRPAIHRLAGTLAGVVLLTGGCAGVPGIYVVEKPGSSAAAQPGAFNANAYAAGIWTTKVVPAVLAKAVDASTVLAAIKADPDGAGKRFGIQSGVGSPYSIMVKGSGRVVAVADATGAGQLQVDLDPADGRPDLSIAIGPVFLGTALRDAVGFINFSQFTNQVDYANAATALNAQVRQRVAATIDTAAATGKSVTFTGAFQLLDPNTIVVTPVRLGIS